MREEIYHGIPCRIYDGSIPFRITMAGVTYPTPDYQVNCRHSRVNRLEYALAGRGVVHAADVTFHPGASDMWLLKEGQDHRYASDPQNPWEKIWVNFSGPLAEDWIRGLKLKQVHYFPSCDLYSPLRHIVDLVACRSVEATEEACFCLARLLWKLQKHVGGEFTEEQQRVHRLISYIDSHIGEGVTLPQLSEYAGLSVSQTIRIFRKHAGQSPYQYILDSKMTVARRLLTETALSVSDIAQHLGYSDEYNFSRAFRKKNGCTPAAFRRR